MIENLIEASSGKLLIPILFAIVGGAVIKAICSVHRTKSADRRDFLELWTKEQDRDDFWLEVAVRHLFGTYLPASLIRSLMRSPQAARAILEVSEFWDLIEIDDETLQLHWRKSTHAEARTRKQRIFGLNVLYFISMGGGLLSGYLAVVGHLSSRMSFNFYIYAAFLIGAAFYCLSRVDLLRTAHTGGPRWLGIP